MPGMGAVIAAQFAQWDLTMPGSLQLEHSIYGTADPEAIARTVDAFCATHLGAGIGAYLFYRSSIGSVSGVRLLDGRGVVVKAHPPVQPVAYLAAMHHVQRHLTQRAFPCPPVVLGPTPLGSGGAVVEGLVDEGAYRHAHDPAIRRIMAEMLARLVYLTGELGNVPGLEMQGVQRRSPNDLWPIPHSALFDFEATEAGAEWIDRFAREARQRLQRDQSAWVIGHMDWSIKHFRFLGDAVRVIYDWDSLRVVREADMVGALSSTFTYTEHLDAPRWPRDDEARAFAREYEAARGCPFSAAEWDAISAAGTYTRAYCARCEHAVAPRDVEFAPGSSRDMLQRYGGADLRL
jgi:hypothetical protein